jgi:antagonist of KipI
MSILVKKAGLLSTVQDLGRPNYRRYGINVGGVMDRAAARLINILVGNDENAAVLEMHFPAPELVFESNASVALGGADLGAHLNDRPIDNWRVHNVPRGSVLRFRQKVHGARAYLAVGGGIGVEPWLGSSSTNLAAGVGGLDGRALQAGDRLEVINDPKLASGARAAISPRLLPLYGSFPTVRVLPGREFEILSEEQRFLFLGQNYKVSADSNRMGYRLKGSSIPITPGVELVSSPVSFGTIQLLPDGQLIVLMADHQTTGGYPRIAHVISHDLSLLAQLGPGDKLAFELINSFAAEALLVRFERDLSFLRVGCQLIK